MSTDHNSDYDELMKIYKVQIDNLYGLAESLMDKTYYKKDGDTIGDPMYNFIGKLNIVRDKNQKIKKIIGTEVNGKYAISITFGYGISLSISFDKVNYNEVISLALGYLYVDNYKDNIPNTLAVNRKINKKVAYIVESSKAESIQKTNYYMIKGKKKVKITKREFLNPNRKKNIMITVTNKIYKKLIKRFSDKKFRIF